MRTKQVCQKSNRINRWPDLSITPDKLDIFTIAKLPPFVWYPFKWDKEMSLPLLGQLQLSYNPALNNDDCWIAAFYYNLLNPLWRLFFGGSVEVLSCCCGCCLSRPQSTAARLTVNANLCGVCCQLVWKAAPAPFLQYFPAAWLFAD